MFLPACPALSPHISVSSHYFTNLTIYFIMPLSLPFRSCVAYPCLATVCVWVQGVSHSHPLSSLALHNTRIILLNEIALTK
jgi:hypothetical protein